MSKHSKFLAGYAISLLFLLPVFSHASSLEEQLQKLRETGIPTTIEELNLPDIPDDKNARFLYEEAAGLQRSLSEKHKELWASFPVWGYVMPWDKVSEEKKKKVIDYILNNSEFNRLCQILEKAVTMECRFIDADRHLQWLDEDYAYLTYMRRLARVLTDKTTIEVHYGDINEALKYILTGLKLGDAILNEPESIAVLVYVDMVKTTLKNLQDIIKKISARSNDSTTVDVRIYQEILKNIRMKQNINLTEKFTKYMLVEGSVIFSHYKNTAKEILKVTETEKTKEEMVRMSKKYLNRLTKEVLKEMFLESGEADITEFIEKQEIIYLNSIRRIIPLTKKPYHKISNKLEKFFEEIGKEIKNKRYAFGLLLPPCLIKKVFLETARYKTLTGTVEMGIANVIFKKQNGRYIDKLSELIPEILPILPVDPFTGKNYIYKRKGMGFIVYSVGENLTDDGGIDRYSREGRKKGSTDIVCEIN
jgi:hypothetical protein